MARHLSTVGLTGIRVVPLELALRRPGFGDLYLVDKGKLHVHTPLCVITARSYHGLRMAGVCYDTRMIAQRR
jgi:hypothetical protein